MFQMFPQIDGRKNWCKSSLSEHFITFEIDSTILNLENLRLKQKSLTLKKKFMKDSSMPEPSISIVPALSNEMSGNFECHIIQI